MDPWDPTKMSWLVPKPQGLRSPLEEHDVPITCDKEMIRMARELGKEYGRQYAAAGGRCPKTARAVGENEWVDVPCALLNGHAGKCLSMGEALLGRAKEIG